jgi:hypothetical protein
LGQRNTWACEFYTFKAMKPQVPCGKLQRSGGDKAARRPLALDRRKLRQQFAAAAKRSPEGREIGEKLEAHRKLWRALRFHDLRHTAAADKLRCRSERLGGQLVRVVDESCKIPSEIGEPPRNRTENPQIKSLLLCQLS